MLFAVCSTCNWSTRSIIRLSFILTFFFRKRKTKELNRMLQLLNHRYAVYKLFVMAITCKIVQNKYLSPYQNWIICKEQQKLLEKRKRPIKMHLISFSFIYIIFFWTINSWKVTARKFIDLLRNLQLECHV